MQKQRDISKMSPISCLPFLDAIVFKLDTMDF